MKMQYIFGGAGTGKTEECFKEMLSLSEDKFKNIIYIVPEQFSLEAERKLAEKSKNKVIMNIQVLSFQRLAYHMFSQTGIKSQKSLDDTAKAMLIRKILNIHKNELKFFKNTNITPGFIDKICDLIKEFHQYSISPNDLLDSSRKNQPEDIKLSDIALIYSSYLSYIENNYISMDEALDILAVNINQLDFIEGAYIWIDNFSGFTPQEYKVISSLLKKAEKVSISLTVRTGDLYYRDLKQNDIFFEIKRAVNKLTDICSKEGIKILSPLLLKDCIRLKDAPDLLFLEKNYFNYRPVRFTGENKRVKIYRALSRYDEVSMAADKIIELVRDKGYQYCDIAILAADMKAYENMVESIFKSYHISFFIDSRMDISAHPLIELVRAAVEIPARDWSYESIFRFLKSGLIPMNKDDIDILENYVIAYGIKGYKWRLPEWLYGFSKDSLFNKDKIHELKNEACKYINYFAEGMSKKTALTGNEFTLRLYHMLKELNVKESMEALYEEAYNKDDKPLMKKHLGAWENLCQVLDKISDIFGDIQMDLSQFFEIFETGILSRDTGAIPPVRDRVIFGDIYRSRLDEIKALIVLGVLENEFPKVKKDDGILGDKDRASLSEKGIELAPDSFQAMQNDNFLIYSVLARATELLILSYPSSDLEGKAMFSSSVISRIEKLFEDTNLDYSEEEFISLPEPMLEKAALGIQNSLKEKNINSLYKALIEWYENNTKYASYIKKIKEIAHSKGHESLSPETTEMLYPREIKTSVSRLEKYAECPFAFFAKYNLGLKERSEYQVRSLDMGNLFHGILEEFSRLIFENNMEWGSLNQRDIDLYTNKAISIVKNNFKSDIFLNDAPATYALQRAERTARKSIWALSLHLKRGSFKPYGAEIDFGIKSPLTGIKIELSEKHILMLTGRIDRVDLLKSDGKVYVKIIDYKSGSKAFNPTDIYYGMQLQLLLYINSLIKNAKALFNIETEMLPGGIFYFRINDPVIEYNEKISPDNIEKFILEQFKMSGLILGESTVIEALDNSIEKSSPVISVNKNAKGEYTSRSGAIADENTFKKAMDYSVEKAKEIGRHMIGGRILPLPFKKGNATGCDYCQYKGICAFDPKENPYNIIKNKNSFNEF